MITSLALACMLWACTDKKTQFIADNVDFATAQTEKMLATVDASKAKFPHSMKADSTVQLTGIYGWTSGFFPGNLWYLYELTGQDKWKQQAEAWTAPLEPLKVFTGHHDLGFMMYCSFGNGYRLDPKESNKAILIEGANSLMTRFNPVTASIKSWDYRKNWNDTTEWFFPVIIDNMMNLELLFWASKVTGDKRYYDVAVTHANTTIKNHVRPDFSCYHVVDYDTITGAVKDRATCQGFSNNSTWARGQAWAIYGFTLMYRETKDPKYLDVAKGMADFFLNHPNLPADKVPYWDFNVGQEGYVAEWGFDPNQFKTTPRDASAAAIVSSALFELAEYTKSDTYRKSAESMLFSLASPAYRATLGKNANFIVMHSVGSIPHKNEIDVPLVYADYYFLEALLRYQKK